VEQLATSIRLGVYQRGTMLPPERELAERLGVSRSTLREAMAALREAGLVETRRGRGGGTVVTVRPRTPSGRAAARVPEGRRAEWLDALEFRRVVEPGAAEIAARADLDDLQRARLEKAHREVSAARRPAQHRQADSRFHLTVATLTGSPRMIEAVTSVQAVLNEMLLAIPVLNANIAHSDRQHAVVVRAILAGKPERARRAMEEHCDDTAALLRGLVG
jgi:GntR family transcriptional repressor for pyruvate dehydrogenase complex